MRSFSVFVLVIAQLACVIQAPPRAGHIPESRTAYTTMAFTRHNTDRRADPFLPNVGRRPIFVETRHDQR